MIDWQNTIALTLVGLAAGYLLRKAWRRVAGHTEKACDTCSHCGATSADDSQSPKTQPLVQIESQYDRTHGPLDDAAR